jgi:predicted nucleic acid-binding protein
VAGYFVDSSALVKRYVLEAGTGWVRSLTNRNANHDIFISRITSVEVTSAIARRRKGGTVSPTQASSILYRFRKHLAGRYTIAEVTPPLSTDAMKLANTHALRAYDAVQLATAIEVQRQWLRLGQGGIVLVSSDKDLNDAAIAEGLIVEDPRQHP